MNKGIINEIAETLGIDKQAVSTRLLFVKTSAADTVWHIVDYQNKTVQGDRFQALHGKAAWLPIGLSADSLIQLSLKETRQILFCEGCIFEFLNARDLIEKDDRLKFALRGAAGSRKVLDQ